MGQSERGLRDAEGPAAVVHTVAPAALSHSESPASGDWHGSVNGVVWELPGQDQGRARSDE
jgi:hypothetical protein